MKAVLGQKGVVEARDAFGAPVLAALYAVPDSPWFLVTRMDTAKVYAPLGERLRLTILIVSLLLISTALIMGAIWWYQRIRFYQERYQIAEALRRSETKFRTLYDSTSDAVMLLDEKGFFDCNPAALVIFGCATREDLCTKHPADVSPPLQPDGTDSRTLANQRIATALEKGANRFEWMHKRADTGKLFPAEVLLSAMELDGKPVLQAVVRDITARKQAEEELRNSRALYFSLVENMPQSVFRKDRAGHFQFVNDRFCRGLRRSPEDIIGRTDADFFPPELAQAYRKDDLRIMETGQALDQEEKHVDADGRELFVHVIKTPLRDAAGKVIGVQGVFSDITERKRAEEALRYEQTLTTTLMDNLPDAVYFKDAASRFLRVNRAMSRKFGLSDPAQLVGKSDMDLFAGEHSRQALADEQEILRTGRPLLNVEEKEIWLDGTVCWVLTTKLPLRDASGRIIGTCGLSRDITERKRAEEALQESRALYYSLAEQLPVGVFRKDREGRFVLVNPEFCRLKGMKAEEFLGKSPREVAAVEAAKQGALGLATKYAAAGVEHHEQIMQTGKPIELVEEYEHADGRKQFLHVMKLPVFGPNGKIVGSQGIQIDITERRLAEETIAHERQLLRTLIDLLPETFYIKDLDSRFLVANEALAKQWGKENPSQLLGLSDADLFPAEQVAQYRAEDLKVFAGEPLMGREGTCVFADGREHRVLTTKVPYRDSQGRICGLVGFGFDITEQKQAREALVASEVRYRRLFEAAKDGILILDAETGMITDANPFLIEKLGLSHEAFLGKKVWELGFFKDIVANQARFAELRQKRYVRYENLPLETADGQRLEVEFISNVYSVNQRKVIQCNIRDITERRRAEIALRESEVRYQRISEAITDYIYTVHIVDGRTVETKHGPGCLAVTGYQMKEFAADPFLWFRMVAAEDRPLVEEQARRILAGEDSPTIEHRIIHKNGTVRWVRNTFVPHRDEHGALVTYDGLIQDITERKQAEEALRDSEKRYRQLFDLESDAIVLIDRETHRYVDVNQTAQQLYGYSREEFLQMTPEDVSAEPEKTRNHIDSADVHVPLRWHRRKNGERFAVEINANQIVHRGRRTALVALRDITERKRAEEVLRESEERFRKIFEEGPLGMAMGGLTDGRFIKVNAALCKMLGYMEEELKRLTFLDVTHPDDRAQDLEAVKRMREGEIQKHTVEKRYLKKNGEVIWGMRSLTLISSTDGKPLYNLAMIEDITVRKRAEDELRAKEGEYRQLFDASPDGVILIGPDGRIVRANIAMARMYGYDSPDDLTGFYPPNFVAPSSREYSEQIMRRRLNGEDIKQVEYELVRKDGTAFYGETLATLLRNEDGTVAGYICITRDTTERKRAEEALRESEAELLSILESTADGILAVDNKGKVIKANQRFVEFGGFPQSIMDVGEDRVLLDFVLKQLPDPDAFLKRVQSLYGTDTVAVDTLVFKDGRVFERHGFPMMLAGAVLGRVWSFRDITERKRQERELFEKSAEMERFTYTVSHDLKSPLVTVKTFLGYLEQDLLSSNKERVKQDVTYMRTAADKMGHLLDELLHLARVGRKTNPPVRVTFKELAQEAVRLVAGRISISHAEVQVAEAAVVLEGDRPRLVEIWQNLVENACKFMGDQPKPRVEIGVELRGGETVFFVRDNGVGIEPRFQHKVFSLFEKLNPRIEGTGMGLALVKRVVELYKGRIWVESGGLGQGANFLFTLPAAVKIETETGRSS